MPGPYDSRGKKVNKVREYDVFSSHNTRLPRKMRINFDANGTKLSPKGPSVRWINT